MGAYVPFAGPVVAGFPDRAVRPAEASIEEAHATGHEICPCLGDTPDHALGGKLGRRSALYIAGMLLDCSRQHSSQRWGEFGSGFQMVVVIKRGDLDRGLRLLGTSPNEIANSRFRSLTAQSELKETLAHAGRIAEGLALVEAGIEQSDGAWGTPELLRLKGELLLTARASCGT
jgi:hypothetical protein